jgi:peptidoglycan biosynthesis protein MviN/MurJ (putative lipid II flippase)
MWTTLTAVVLNLILNLVLIWTPLRVAGLALSTSLCSYLQVGILLKGLIKKFGKEIFDGFTVEFVKTLVNTVIMSFAAVLSMKLAAHLPQLVQMLIVVVTAAAIYLIGAAVLRIQMLSLITGRKLLK